MKVKIIRATVAQKRTVLAGEELDVSKDEAMQLVSAGKALVLKDAAVETADKPMAEAETTSVPMDEVETTDTPAVNTESFAPTVKRGGKKKVSE